MRFSRVTVALLALSALAAAGCGPDGPKTYPVRGRIELARGDVKHLAGSTIEAALEADPTVRAAGEIKEDGSFTLETLHQGVILKGAQAGKYQVRIILADDDRAARKRASQQLDPRFLQFQTSALSFEVPAEGEVVLKASGR